MWRKLFVVTSFLWLAACSHQSTEPAATRAALSTTGIRPHPGFGVELGGVNDWTPAPPFANAAKSFRMPWGQVGAPWVPLTGLALTAHGYPLQPAETLSYLADYPTGDYRISYVGNGTVYVAGAFTLTTPWTVVNGRHQATVRANVMPGQLFVIGIRDVGANATVDDLRLVPPGLTDADLDGVFHPRFLQTLAGYSSFRYMDWQQTNNSTLRDWSQRSHVEDFSQTNPVGVSYDHIVTLTNLTGRDIWINVPHLATEDFVRQLARLLVNGLDWNRIAAIRAGLGLGPLVVRAEYSNETWNSIFEQAKWMQTTALANPALTHADAFGRMAEQSAVLSRRMGQIFREEFSAAGHGGNFRNVFGGFVATSYWAETALAYVQSKFGDAKTSFDDLAVAPYVPLDDALDVENLTLDALFSALNEYADKGLKSGIHDNAAVARKYGQTLVAYEGGQHLVFWNGTKGREQNGNVKWLAQYDVRMRQLYEKLWTTWQAEGGGHFNWFAHIGQYSKWGFWGLLESMLTDDSACRRNLLQRVDSENATTLSGVDAPCPKWDFIMTQVEALAPMATPRSLLDTIPSVVTGKFVRNENAARGPLIVDGKSYSIGIGTSPDSDLEYDFGEDAVSFTARVAMDRNAGAGLAIVEFLVNDRSVFVTSDLRAGAPSQAVSFRFPAGGGHVDIRVRGAPGSNVDIVDILTYTLKR